MTKVALHNLGCKVNAYELEFIQQMFTRNGYEIVPFDEKADIYIVNTCTVTNIADRKSRQMLHRAKKRNPKAIVVATGCYVQTDRTEAGKDESIDLMVGNNRKKEIVGLVEQLLESRRAGLSMKTERACPFEKDTAVPDIAVETVYEEFKLEQAGEHTRAYIKIQDGCNQFCSYCVIPYARGRVRSRRKEDVLAEIEKLAENGYQEVVLTGIHVSSYGLDFHRDGEERDVSYNMVAADGSFTNTELLSLIKQVHEIKGVRRIRLGSLEPRIITEEFLEGLAGLPKFCPHFHLSLQSGSDAVLKRMNRRYSVCEYYEKTELIRHHFAHPALTTDVITGFPGETEEEFEETRAFLQKINFYEVHVFKYSRRRKTAADRMPNQLTEKEKAARSSVLIEESAKRSREYRAWYVGRLIDVLLEEGQEIAGEYYQTGYTKEYVKAAVRTQEDLGNQIIPGRADGMLTDEILVFSSELE